MRWQWKKNINKGHFEAFEEEIRDLDEGHSNKKPKEIILVSIEAWSWISTNWVDWKWDCESSETNGLSCQRIHWRLLDGILYTIYCKIVPILSYNNAINLQSYFLESIISAADLKQLILKD